MNQGYSIPRRRLGWKLAMFLILAVVGLAGCSRPYGVLKMYPDDRLPGIDSYLDDGAKLIAIRCSS